jgi:UDP:flavonoid glycosyltransferase YjiC (YdhE family)
MVPTTARTTYLFTTLPSNDLGLLVRSLPIAAELAGRGHEVTFCSPGQAPSKAIAEAGFRNFLPRHPVFYYLAADLSVRGMLQATQAGCAELGLRTFFGQLARAMPRKLVPMTSEVWNMDQLAAQSGMVNENLVHACVEAMVALVEESGADVVVDFCNPFACIAARVAGRPLIGVLQADMHPASKGFIWWRDPPADLPTAVPAMNGVLAEYGLDPVTKVDELLVGDMTLMVGIPETDPLPETAEVTYVGPILWQKAGSSLPDWATDLRADRPVIWTYSGNPRYTSFLPSPVDSAVVLEACVDALGDSDARGAQVVLTTGHHALPKGLLPLPDNFIYTPFVPGLAMAERSDLLIHHGGYGSCQTGLYTGTPAVMIPTYAERESNARRVAAVGAGQVVLPTGKGWRKKRVDASELRAKVEQVLADPSYTANAKRTGERLRAYGGAAEAARLIAAFGQNNARA